MAKRRTDSDGNAIGGTRRASNVADKFSYGEMRFVNIELTAEEKEEFRKLLDANEFHPSFLDRCLAQNYTVTIGKDKRGNGILCSIRAEYKDMLDGGLILTGRGKDVLTAIAVCEYKNGYLADENGWLAAETARAGSYSDIG